MLQLSRLSGPLFRRNDTYRRNPSLVVSFPREGRKEGEEVWSCAWGTWKNPKKEKDMKAYTTICPSVPSSRTLGRERQEHGQLNPFQEETLTMERFLLGRNSWTPVSSSSPAWGILVCWRWDGFWEDICLLFFWNSFFFFLVTYSIISLL